MANFLTMLWPSAQLLCRMSVTFICVVIVVLQPTARIAGPYTFLILTTKDIVFPPSTSPSAQIEALAVNTSGVVFGLGWSNLGLACATFAGRKYGVDSSAVRAIKACFLVILAFLSGLARSGLPRLAFASRAACFVGVWLLSRTATTDKWDYHNFTQLLFICSIPGAASLLVSLAARIFTHPGGYPKDVIDALSRLKSLLELSTARAFGQPDNDQSRNDLHLTPTTSTVNTFTTSTEPPSQIEDLQKSCLNDSLALHTSYAYSAFELRIGRVPVKDIKPLLNTVNRIREELAWGDGSKNYSSLLSPDMHKRKIRDRGPLDELDEPSRVCASALGNGISVLQAVVGKCYGIKLGSGQTTFEEPLICREKIISARAELKARLDSAVHRANQIGRVMDDEYEQEEVDIATVATIHDNILFQKSLQVTSLLHMSSELIRALTLAHAILEIHRTSTRPRLFFLRPSWLWLGMSPRALVAEEDGPSPDLPTSPTPDADVLSVQEADTTLPGVVTLSPKRWRLKRIWNSPGILRFRIRLSKMIWRMRHSKHIHNGIRNAFGVGLLLIPAVLPAGSAGKHYFDTDYGVWAIISFTYVLESNTALTWRIGIWRLFGTTIGATYAYLTWVIVRQNPYGIVALVTAAEIMLTWLVRSSTPGVGVVASVTIPPVLFQRYLGLNNAPMIDVAALRGLQISIGIVAAIIVNHVLFPKHPRVLFLSGMAQVLDELSALYLHLSHQSYNDRERVRNKKGIAHSAKLELRIRELIARENVWLTQMEHEISLMPKPTRLYRASAEHVQRFADLVSGLRRIRENVPQQAIEQVLQHRQHTVSCVSIVLFACEHAFRSRRSLPQMLPSPRKALDAQSREMMEVLQDSVGATDIGYAVAEHEVLESIVETLDGLTSVTRALFGTHAWLEGGGQSIPGSFGLSGAATPASLRRTGSYHPW
ncbi:fusaric acid resistance-like protein [Ceratobasidium sp. AG-Ba]|nr:fusaric acid resistance-like protein [Ceratobasidium sp. AG-Ba]